MFVVDTDLLLHAVNRDAPEHARARERLDSWRAGPEAWFTTGSVVYEFLRVSTHRSVFPHPLGPGQAWSFIMALLARPTFSVLPETRRHAEVVAAMVKEFPDLIGNILHDLHTAALMREHGIVAIRTADRDFARFGFLHVVDPLAG